MNSRIRPSEQVRSYLEQKFLDEGHGGERLPSIDSLATHLKVSPNTVRTVIRELTAEGRLQTTQGRGVFVIPRETTENRPLVIATNLIRYDSHHLDNWTELIYMGAARHAFSLRRNLSLAPVSHRSKEDGDDAYRELAERITEIDMLMLFPSSNSRQIQNLYEKAGKPVITINPPALTSTSNFVSADFYGASFRVGRGWYEAGRRNILCVGPVFKQRYSASMQLYFHGLLEGCRRDDDPTVRLRILNIDLGSSPETLATELLPADFIPDAIFCMGDIVGSRILSHVREAGYSVPEDISIVAGTGLPDHMLAYPELTRIMQPMEQIGARAVDLLCHRLDHSNANVAGHYLTTPINHGSTTRPVENARFDKLYTQSLRELL